MALTEDKNLITEGTENNEIRSQIPSKDEIVENNTSVDTTSEFDGEIDLSATRKKRFRIDGDNNRYLELNTSDMSIINRLEQLYPRLQKLSQDAAVKKLETEEADDEKALTKVSNALTRIDVQMRQLLDEIFDSNVSEMCAPSGSMIDPFNGEFRFEHIIDVITKLYENNINTEFKKMSDRMKKRTAKYTKKR